jgi:hypothetical protein
LTDVFHDQVRSSYKYRVWGYTSLSNICAEIFPQNPDRRAVAHQNVT